MKYQMKRDGAYWLVILAETGDVKVVTESMTFAAAECSRLNILSKPAPVVTPRKAARLAYLVEKQQAGVR